jgi:DNA-binding transcriptional MerR regulator
LVEKRQKIPIFSSEMTSNTIFPTDIVLCVTGASANQLKYWVKIGLITPFKDGKRYLYSFRDIIRIRVVTNLKNNGLSLQKIRKGIDNLAEVLPAEDDPLARLVIFTDGQDMIAMEKGMYFSATSMQRYFRFDLEQLQAKIFKIKSEKADKGTESLSKIGSVDR